MKQRSIGQTIPYLLGASAAAFAWWYGSQRTRRSLAGKVVLLTGGSRGLGLAIARQLAEEGSKLILVARDSKELNAAATELIGYGADVHVLACDLTDAAQIRETLESAVALHGRIDIVINNAGRIDVVPVDAVTEDDFRASLDLMFWAPLRIFLHLLPGFLRAGDADIVNIASIGGIIAVPHLGPYSAAKFALVGLSEGLGVELRGRGIHVLTVTPGLMRTGGHKKAIFSGDEEGEYRWFALGATMPGVAMEVNRAARKIVMALQKRQRTLTITWSAQVASKLHGVFPNMTLVLLGMMNELLPQPVSRRAKVQGAELAPQQSSAFRLVTALGEQAAKQQHENVS